MLLDSLILETNADILQVTIFAQSLCLQSTQINFKNVVIEFFLRTPELAKIAQDYFAPTVEQKIPIYLFTNIFVTVHLNIFTVEGLNKKERKVSSKCQAGTM